MITEAELLDTAELMRINLTEWQKELIFDRAEKHWCINCGRKLGKTTAIEFRVTLRLLNDDVKGDGLVGGIGIVSEELKAAKQILAGIKTILTALGWRLVSEPKYMSEDKKVAYATTQEIKMPNGNRVLVFPAGIAGDNIRPYTLHEFIYDEADFIPNEVYTATGPCLARFDGVEILESTPNKLGDKTTYFAKAFFGDHPGYKVLFLPSANENWKTTSPHISQAWIDSYRQTHTTQECERELRAQYTSDISCVFPSKIVAECLSDDWPSYADARFLGVKFASFDCENSYVIENIYQNGICWLKLHILPHMGRRITDIEAEVIRLSGNSTRVVIDNSSLGSVPIESLALVLGEDVVLGVSNHEVLREIEGARSRYMKEDLYVGALKLIERGTVKFTDVRIQAALIDAKYKYSRRNKALYIQGNDITDALVRAVFPIWGRNEWLSREKPAIFFEKYK